MGQGNLPTWSHLLRSSKQARVGDKVGASYNIHMSSFEVWSTLLQLGLHIPWRLAASSNDFLPPKKAIILQPGDETEVLFTTPLAFVLNRAYPQMRLDWAVSKTARPLLLTQPFIHRLLPAGNIGTPQSSLSELRDFIQLLREQEYDTCFIPNRASLYATIAWQAYIPQRVGLNHNGRGTTHSTAVNSHKNLHPVDEKLRLAEALGLGTVGARLSFHPTDEERSRMVAYLMEEIGWNNERPLVLINPTTTGLHTTADREHGQWPIERFALLGNHLARQNNAHILILSPKSESTRYADQLNGLFSVPTQNLAGELTIGEIGALCELAQLYIGNDTGLSYMALSQQCPTLFIHSTNRAQPIDIPHAVDHRHAWEPYTGRFNWDKGVSTEAAITLANELLVQSPRTEADQTAEIA